MASKISGRDINGMRAVGWSQPNLDAIQSIKVDAKCSNADLLEAIKQIVSESVTALRGTNADDKYRNIVDMLMLRVRGALAKTMQELEDSTVDVDTSSIAESIADAAAALIKEKIDPKNGLVLIDKDNLKELVDAIVSAVEGKVQSAKEKDVDKLAPAQIEKTVIESTEAQTIDKAPIESTSAQPAQVDASQAISISDINKLQTEIDKNFKKIESLIQQTSVTQTIAIEKTVDESSKKLEQKTTVITQTQKVVDGEDGKGKVKDVLTGRQFTELLKMLAKCQTQTINLIGAAIESTNKQFGKLNEQLEKIWDHLNKSKISWLAILAGVSMFLIPLFWDKIVGFFKWLNSKFDISSIIERFISSINWNKYVGLVIDNIWEALKQKFQDIVQNPMDWVVGKFKAAYTAMTEWTKDIWEWVKSKLSWTKQKQDENEAKAEKESTEKFQAALTNLESHTNANVQKVEESANAACEDAKVDVAQKSADIHSQVEAMQQNANEQITATTEAVQENSDNINNVVLPGMSADIEKAVDGAGQKVENRSDAAISASEAKLNGAINDLDKKLEENGAPTSVSKETLAKMDSAGEGSSISKGGIDQKVEGPKTVVQTTTVEQGKMVQLYAKKEDVDRAASENAEVNALVGNLSNGTPNVTNINVNGGKTQANIQNKILVNGKGSPVEREAKIYDDMNATINEVSKNSATIESGLNKNQTLLGKLQEKVSDYFGELNGLVKALKDKPAAQHNSNVILMDSGGNGTPRNSAQMDDF